MLFSFSRSRLSKGYPQCPRRPSAVPDDQAQCPSTWAVTIALCLCALLSACQRPTLGGVQAVDCGSGDRVVSLSRVFCVYDQLSASPPSAGTAGTAGTIGQGGSEAGGVAGQVSAGVESSALTCPEALPYAYSFAGLTICSREGTLSPNTIEAVAAQWATDFGVTEPSSGAQGGAIGGMTAGAQAGAEAGVTAGAQGTGALPVGNVMVDIERDMGIDP